MSISNSELNILNLVIGLPKAPGDEVESGEQGQKILSLTGDSQTNMGFSLQTLNGWNPQIASMKGGGAWIDNPAVEGRTLTADAVGNVIETITCTLKASTLLEAGEYIVLLQRLVQEARDFASEFYQRTPVYLEWKPIGQKVHQYALIYNIDMAITHNSTVYLEVMYDVVFTIEREPYWRIGVPPGMPAKIWTLIKNGVYSSYAKVDLNMFYDATIEPSLVEDTLDNKLEQDGLASDSNVRLSQNYIEIPADDIPGDVPALMTLSIRQELGNVPGSAGVPANFYIGRDTKHDIPDPSAPPKYFEYFAMAGGDGANVSGVSTVSKVSNVDGVISNGAGAGGTKYIADVTMGAGTWDERAWYTWSGIIKRREPYRGRYMVFLRHSLQSGTSAHLKMFVRAFYGQFYGARPLATIYSQTDQLVNPVTITSGPSLTYLGELTIPSNVPQAVGMNGQGVDVDTRVEFQLWRKAQTGASAMVVRIVDLILIPIDEGACVVDALLDPTINSALLIVTPVATDAITMIDNTGYFARGQREDVAYATLSAVADIPASVGNFSVPAKVGLSVPTLIPGKTNKIHIINTTRVLTTFPAYEEASFPNREMEVTVNIVPRCTYLANVEV